MIKPTVGRVVIYRPTHEPHLTSAREDGQGHVALIAHVWNETCVNLAIFDADGLPYSRTSVYLVQEGDAAPGSGHCQWMPYQHGQAAKAEALEAKLSAAKGEAQ